MGLIILAIELSKDNRLKNVVFDHNDTEFQPNYETLSLIGKALSEASEAEMAIDKLVKMTK